MQFFHQHARPKPDDVCISLFRLGGAVNAHKWGRMIFGPGLILAIMDGVQANSNCEPMLKSARDRLMWVHTNIPSVVYSYRNIEEYCDLYAWMSASDAIMCLLATEGAEGHYAIP
jgi:hypothetical protein